jgi:hypothetical protein
MNEEVDDLWSNPVVAEKVLISLGLPNEFRMFRIGFFLRWNAF